MMHCSTYDWYEHGIFHQIRMSVSHLDLVGVDAVSVEGACLPQETCLCFSGHLTTERSKVKRHMKNFHFRGPVMTLATYFPFSSTQIFELVKSLVCIFDKIKSKKKKKHFTE